MTKRFNLLPMTTFRGTDSNYTALSVPERKVKSAQISWSGDTDVVTSVREFDEEVLAFVPKEFRGADPDTLREALCSGMPKYLIEVAADSIAHLRLDLCFTAANPDWYGAICLKLAEGAMLELVLALYGDDVTAGVFNGAVFTDLAPAAAVHITKVHYGMAGAMAIEHRYTRIAREARADYVAAEFGARCVIYHGDADLVGEKAEISEECVYIGGPGEHVDLYYDRNHYARQTDSHLATRGALFADAKKVFRGCIDFKKGASGAVGNEEDYVVMLSPTAKNISLPLLLCTEDDVQGNHASSAGQMDQERLFYLMSRGVSEREAKRILVESMLRPTLDRIHGDDLRSAAIHAVAEKMGSI